MPWFQSYFTVQKILSVVVAFTKHKFLNVNDKFKLKKNIHTSIQSSKPYVVDELHSADCIVKMLQMQLAEAEIPCILTIVHIVMCHSHSVNSAFHLLCLMSQLLLPVEPGQGGQVALGGRNFDSNYGNKWDYFVVLRSVC